MVSSGRTFDSFRVRVTANKPDGLIQDKSSRIFQGRLWLKKGCIASDDDDDDGGFKHEAIPPIYSDSTLFILLSLY
jgi:hypothetical protein